MVISHREMQKNFLVGFFVISAQIIVLLQHVIQVTNHSNFIFLEFYLNSVTCLIILN